MSRRKKKRNNRKSEMEYLEFALKLNGAAAHDPIPKKKWTTHDLKAIKPLTPNQTDMFHAWFNGFNICAHGSAGTGKAQPLTSKVLTPDGWVNMGEISVGQSICTPSGDIATVEKIFPQNKKQIYKITFHDGSSARCCAEHLWETYDRKSTKRLLQTSDLITLLDHGMDVYIPTITNLTTSSNVKIDITNNNESIDIFGSAFATYINQATYLYKKYDYQTSLLLVKNFVDMYGVIHSDGVVVTFTNAEQYQQLFWSVGCACSVLDKNSLYVQYYNYPSLFRQKAKQQASYDISPFYGRRIVSIQRDGYEEAQCILIDHPDHLYITDDYVVTHNTFLAAYLAINDVLNNQYQHLNIIRSVVPTREVGHLPGSLEEKTALYELPYYDIFGELFGRRSTYADMKRAGLIRFTTTSFVRGVTWDNAVILVDEGQNMTFHEIDSIMTRLGVNSKIIFTGDIIQTDLTTKRDQPGIDRFIRVIQNMDEFAEIKFNHHDIVRSEFVKSWIKASECS